MISVNPIFFPSNTISKIPFENSTKLFKNPKYLFADLIKVNESNLNEESDFPESFFKLTENSGVEKSGELGEQYLKNFGEAEVSADVSPILSMLLNLPKNDEYQVDNEQTNLKAESNENGTIKLTNINEDDLKALLEEIVNTSNVKIKDYEKQETVNSAGGKTVQNYPTETGKQTTNASNVSQILDRLNNGLPVSFEIQGSQTGKLFTVLKEILNHPGENTPELVANLVSGDNEQVNNVPLVNGDEISELFNSSAGNDGQKLRIKISGENSVVKESSAIKDESLSQLKKLINLNESSTGKGTSTVDLLSPNENQKAGDSQNKFVVSIEVLKNQAAGKEKDIQPFQFVKKDELKTLLQRDDNLKQLRSKISNIFRNVEQVNPGDEQPGNKSLSEDNKINKGKVGGSNQTGTNQKTSEASGKRIANNHTTEIPVTEKTVEGEQLITDKSLPTQTDKAKIEIPGFVESNTDKIVENNQVNPGNGKFSKEFKVDLKNPGTSKSTNVKLDGNGKIKLKTVNTTSEKLVDVNKIELEDVTNEKKVENKVTSSEQNIFEPDEKIKTGNTKLFKTSTSKTVEGIQIKSENAEFIKESRIDFSNSTVEEQTNGKVEKNSQTKPGKDYSVKEESIKLNETEQIASEKVVENKPSVKDQKNSISDEKNKIPNTIEKIEIGNELGSDKNPTEKDVKVSDPGLTKREVEKTVDVKQSKADDYKVVGENKTGGKKPEFVNQPTDKKGDSKQIQTNDFNAVPEETIKQNKPGINNTVIDKTKENKPAGLENIEFSKNETVKNNTEVNHDNKQSDSNLNGNSLEQTKNDNPSPVINENPETFAVDNNKKVDPVENEVLTFKDAVIDKTLLNNVVHNTVENVNPQPEVLNNLEVFNKITELIRAKDKKSIEIKLDPPDLGKMNIRIDHEQNKIYINIEVKDESVRGMIYHNLDQLRQTINQNGLQLQNLSVSLNGEEHRQFKSLNKNKRGSTEKIDGFTEKTDSELSAKMMGYNTYDFLI